MYLDTDTRYSNVCIDTFIHTLLLEYYIDMYAMPSKKKVNNVREVICAELNTFV